MAERGIISHIRKQFSNQNPRLFMGIGDDCALFGNQSSNPWMISTDMLVNDIHFNLLWHDPYRLGRKSISVNISDIAAMGGVPQFVLLNLCLPDNVAITWVEDMLRGVSDICRQFGCELIGGDTVSGKELSLSVTVIGTSDGVKPVKRSGAQSGDLIYVSGFLGSAALGLELFQRDPDSTDLTPFHYAHLDPLAQVNLGRELAQQEIVSAMQDISDGIATDLAHLCFESGVGARIYEHMLPMQEGFSALCTKLGLDSTALQLKGGEDYQLVFSVPQNKRACLEDMLDKGFSCTQIGTIETGEGVVLVREDGRKEDISYQGYEHA